VAGERPEEPESARTPGPSPGATPGATPAATPGASPQVWLPEVLPPAEQTEREGDWTGCKSCLTSLPMEQLSFVSSDGQDPHPGSACVSPFHGDVDARSDGGTVSRFVSGIVTARAGGDGEDGAHTAEAYETTLLKRQLEQAWQLGHALRSQMPEPEQAPGVTPEDRTAPLVVPPQPGGYLGAAPVQPARQVRSVGSPWPPGVLTPRYAPDCHAGHLEGLQGLPRCVVTYTTTTMVSSRSPTPLVARTS